MLPNDFIAGLSMGLKFAEVVSDSATPTSPSRFPLLSGLLGLLLFPTVYEPASWILDPSSIEKSWADGRGSLKRKLLLKEYLDSVLLPTSDTRKGDLSAVDSLPASASSSSPATNSSLSSSLKKDRKLSVSVTSGASAKKRFSSVLRTGVSFSLDSEDEEQRKKSAIEALMSSPETALDMLRTEMYIFLSLIIIFISILPFQHTLILLFFSKTNVEVARESRKQ